MNEYIEMKEINSWRFFNGLNFI
jgi:hypothetical protein